ncbi:MAG: DUF4860 domain-containing protein [Oscillospiraceae bacterium]|nr:DUF4860 domain-containing protein [Oscillospiraceae bacterium]
MKKSNLGFLLAMLVFALFMVSVLAVLLSGADVVQGITRRDQKSYEQRTAVQYVATRIRQAEEAGKIFVRESEAGDRLVLAETIEGIEFETAVYCYDGYLRELFSISGYDPGAEFGEKILPAAQFSVSDEGDYLNIEITFEDGSTQEMIIALRSERGAAHEE